MVELLDGAQVVVVVHVRRVVDEEVEIVWLVAEQQVEEVCDSVGSWSWATTSREAMVICTPAVNSSYSALCTSSGTDYI